MIPIEQWLIQRATELGIPLPARELRVCDRAGMDIAPSRQFQSDKAYRKYTMDCRIEVSKEYSDDPHESCPRCGHLSPVNPCTAYYWSQWLDPPTDLDENMDPKEMLIRDLFVELVNRMGMALLKPNVEDSARETQTWKVD